jgi:hypothetical protein
VLPVGEDDAADSHHVHVADGFPDHRKSVVPNFSVRDQVVRPDEVAGIYVALRNELVDVNCPVDSNAMFSSSSFDTSMYVSASTL